MSRITKVTEPIEGVAHVHFENQYDVTSTFMRLQEFYESPYDNIKGKEFEVEEYMDTYADDTGNFTYNTDWSGFNVPGNIVNEFFSQPWHYYLDKEWKLNQALVPFKRRGEPYYVIGTFKEETIDHELAHAMYYLKPEYKETMDNLTSQMTSECYVDFEKALKDLGYCNEVIRDEMQAYLATSSYWYLLKHFSTICFPWRMVRHYRKAFNAAKETYMEKPNE